MLIDDPFIMYWYVYEGVNSMIREVVLTQWAVVVYEYAWKCLTMRDVDDW